MAKKKKSDRGIRVPKNNDSLRYQRKRQGYTIQTLAEKLPPQDPKTIGKAERGETIDPFQLKTICDKLNLSPITLLPNTPNPLERPPAEKIKLPQKLTGYAPTPLIEFFQKNKEALRIFFELLQMGYIKDGVIGIGLEFSGGILANGELRRVAKAYVAGDLRWLDAESVKPNAPPPLQIAKPTAKTPRPKQHADSLDPHQLRQLRKALKKRRPFVRPNESDGELG